MGSMPITTNTEELTHSIFTVSPFLMVPANGISGCHLLCSFSCFSAGISKDTLHTLRISVNPMLKMGGCLAGSRGGRKEGYQSSWSWRQIDPMERVLLSRRDEVRNEEGLILSSYLIKQGRQSATINRHMNKQYIPWTNDVVQLHPR